MKAQEEIIEKFKEIPISNIDEAIKFLNERECAREVISVDWKWEVAFDDKDNYKFYDDEDLINWCREQRDTYFTKQE